MKMKRVILVLILLLVGCSDEFENEVPKPDNSFLLFEEEWKLGGYSVFTAEEGPCEMGSRWPVYETDIKVYMFSTNDGCNPEWIGAPLYVKVGESLLSVSDAIVLGYLDEQDLIDSDKISWEANQ